MSGLTITNGVDDFGIPVSGGIITPQPAQYSAAQIGQINTALGAPGVQSTSAPSTSGIGGFFQRIQNGTDPLDQWLNANIPGVQAGVNSINQTTTAAGNAFAQTTVGGALSSAVSGAAAVTTGVGSLLTIVTDLPRMITIIAGLILLIAGLFLLGNKSAVNIVGKVQDLTGAAA